MSGASGDRLRVSSDGKDWTGRAQIRRVSLRDAVQRGIKAGGLVALAALSTIIVPGVHFISVPGGLLAAPVVALLVFTRLKGSVSGVAGAFPCPHCGSLNTIDINDGRPPYYGSCSGCQSPYDAWPEAEE